MLPSGQAMTQLGIAVNRTWRDKDGSQQEEVSYFNLVAFDKRAETLGKYARKGNRMFVDGRLRARTVQNDKGESRTFHDVVVEEFQFLGGTAKASEAETADAGGQDDHD
jgi:single-strand DNA-binding protein